MDFARNVERGGDPLELGSAPRDEPQGCAEPRVAAGERCTQTARRPGDDYALRLGPLLDYFVRRWRESRTRSSRTTIMSLIDGAMLPEVM